VTISNDAGINPFSHLAGSASQYKTACRKCPSGPGGWPSYMNFASSFVGSSSLPYDVSMILLDLKVVLNMPSISFISIIANAKIQ